MRSFNLIATSLTLVMGGAVLAPNANASISLNFHTNKHTIKSDGDSNVYIKGPGVDNFSVTSKHLRDLGRQNDWKFNESQANHWVRQWNERGPAGQVGRPTGDTKSLETSDSFEDFYRDAGQMVYQNKVKSNRQQQQRSKPAPRPQPQISASRSQTEYEAMMERVDSGAPTPSRSTSSPAPRSTSRPTNTASSRCPAGTSYHKIKSGGLLFKRTVAEGCYTDFQASQLRMQANSNQRQRQRDFQRDIQDATRGPVNCSGTVNSLGNGYATYNTNCY